jgi:hypothetical protein
VTVGDPLGVTITGAEMYRELVSLVRAVDQLASEVKNTHTGQSDRMEALAAADAAHAADLDKLRDDHETRLRTLEKTIYRGLGALAILSPGVAFLTARLTGG